MKYDICILGLGYIGLPTAAAFAKIGKTVFGVDVSEKIVNTVNTGQIHIVEPGLAELINEAVNNKNLKAGTQPLPASCFIIAVPTPFKKTAANPKTPDLSYVENASRSIAAVIEKGDLVILESTSPVGTTEKIINWINDQRNKSNLPNLDRNEICFAHCPERVLPGKMLEELKTNDRVIGGTTDKATTRAAELYSKICSGEIFCTTAKTAEMVKLTENSYRDTNIAFANEISVICDELGLDVWEVIELANRHPRVKILQPGPGVGGHCIAVDPWFIVDSAPESSELIKSARRVNDNKPNHIARKILKIAEPLDNPRIACLGLTFKADIDDMRESPARQITEMLSKIERLQLMIVEPNISQLPESLSNQRNVKLVELGEAVTNSDIILLLVDHKEFRGLNQNILKTKHIVDTKGIWR